MNGEHPRPGPRRASTRGTHRWPARLVAVAAVGLAGACSGTAGPQVDAGPASATASAIAVPDDAAAWRLPIPELEAVERGLARDARAHEASPHGVEAARDAARLARVLARRARDGSWITTARQLLREASRRKALAGACDASIELARLEAGDAGDLAAAYVVAYRTSRRFTGPAHDGCTRQARRLLAVLEPARPPASELAPIDADPDGDDPSDPGAAEGVPAGVEPDVARWARARGAGTEPSATLDDVTVYGGHADAHQAAASARVVLRFDHVALFTRGELPEQAPLPHRVYLDFVGARLGASVAAATEVSAAGLRRVRAGPLDAERLRVTLDLDADAGVRLFFLADPYRIVLDVERGAAREPQPATAQGARPLRVVVVDPGHGGNDSGARGAAGLRESVLALDIAKRVKRSLEARLAGTRVLLTRSNDSFVSLEQRAAIANVLDADAFVSIHLNASETPTESGGVAAFVLDTTDDRQALRLAAAENGTSEREVSALALVLASVSRAEQSRRSRDLARLVQRGALAGGRRVLPRLADRGVRSALFYVLVGARMPAILLETSFISRADEARALATEPYRQSLADGITEGLVRYARGE